MSTALFLESVSGIAGDMFAAAFVDAGLVSREELEALPALAGLDGVTIAASGVTRATMRATHLSVRAAGAGTGHAETHLLHAHGGHGHAHTHHADIDRLLETSRLDAPVRDRARRIFRMLAEAEASAHGMEVGDVAFHEVGSVDSIVDVVMAAYCASRFGAGAVFATPVKVGRGTVKMEHGTHPIPPPASARLLVGMPVAAVPEAIARPNVELSTPTGLAILKELSPTFVDSLPPGRVLAQGMGAGTMDLASYPNVFRIVLLDGAGGGPLPPLPYEQDQAVEIACNIDDDTPERVAWLAERLLHMGALDVWTTPATGKKGRAAVVLSVLAAPADWRPLADWLLRNSSTFGVRHRAWDRLKLVRRFEERATGLGRVTYKVGSTTDGTVLKEKAEFEDLRKAWDNPPEP